MDFFDVLRQGCTFAGAKHSKEVAFQKKPHARHEPAPQTGTGSLDFFGYNAREASQSTLTDAPSRQAAADTEADSDGDSASSSPPATGNAMIDNVKPRRKKLDPVAAFRQKHRINASVGAPDPVESFDAMLNRGVPDWLVKNLRGLGFKSPTAVQMQCFPAVLAGSHVLASAPTGSGKTIAFLGPLLALLAKPGKEFARVVIIDPSRELAKQTLDEFVKLTAGKKWAGRLVDRLSGEKAKSIKRLDIAIATPLRLAQLLREDRISLDATQHLVLDEADKLLDLGFAPQIDEILSFLPKNNGPPVQTLMFSATLGPAVCELAGSILTSPLRVSIGNVNAAAEEVEQRLLFITHEDGKLFSFRQLVQEGQIKPPALIFVQSKDRAKELFGELVYDGIFVDAIHADRTKQQRDNTVTAFRTGKIWMLICTDLMARGVDFKSVETVVNYDFPLSASTYIHRIGRTGRAGRTGTAMTFFTISDFGSLRSIVGVMRQSGCEVPEWMLRLRKAPRKVRRYREQHAPMRKSISTVSRWDLEQGRKRRKRQAGNQTGKGGKPQNRTAAAPETPNAGVKVKSGKTKNAAIGAADTSSKKRKRPAEKLATSSKKRRKKPSNGDQQ